MNGIRTSRDLGPLLESWMATAAPDRAPERLLEEAFARTMTTRQLPVYPWHALRSRRGSGPTARATRDVAISMVAVAIAVVIGAGLLLRFGQAEVGRSSPSPGATPSAASASPSASAGQPSAGPSFPMAIAVTPQAAIPVANPVSLVSDGTSLWLFTSTGEAERIDPASNAVAASVQLPRSTDAFQAMAGNATGLWVTDWDASLLLRLEPRTLKSIAEIHVGAQPKGIRPADGAVWIANTHGGTVSRVDPGRNRVVATITVGPTGASGPNWLAQGFGSIWVDVPNAGYVVRINPATNAALATIPVPTPADPCGGLAVTSNAIWVASCDTYSLTRIDPATNQVVATVNVGGFSHVFAVIGDRPWISPEAGQIVRIDPATNTVDRVITPGAGFQGGDITVADGSVWIIDLAANRVLRLPLTPFGG